MSDPEGWRIALQRIAEEAEQKTGFLDLGELGLTSLPKELRQLEHLTRLNLGNWYETSEGEVNWSISRYLIAKSTI